MGSLRGSGRPRVVRATDQPQLLAQLGDHPRLLDALEVALQLLDLLASLPCGERQ